LLNITKDRDIAWPTSLRPVNHDEWDKEDFSSWWEKHCDQLGHLHPQICEQWVHRHWAHNYFCFLDLMRIEWELIELDTDEALRFIYRDFAQPLHPEFDLKQLNGRLCKHPVARAFEEHDTWDYPVIVLSTPYGIIGYTGEQPDVRHVLVEGHQRHRYLNALFVLGKAPKRRHKIFIISTDQVTDLN